jgi:UDP-N-acetylglucosamine transferase subunit ALG13
VTIGTDPHPFARLIDWVDRWMAEQQNLDAVIQHSTTGRPTRGRPVAYLPSARLQQLVGEASIVVCHAGTIVSECLVLGVVPVVVPRRRQLGEAVDDHQIRFARRLAQEGTVVCCETEEELRTELSRRLASGDVHRHATTPLRLHGPPTGIERAGLELDRLLTASHGGPIPDVASWRWAVSRAAQRTVSLLTDPLRRRERSVPAREPAGDRSTRCGPLRSSAHATVAHRPGKHSTTIDDRRMTGMGRSAHVS